MKRINKQAKIATMTKMIKNEQWQASDLFHKIKNNEIRNPKFQRNRKWRVLEANGNTKNPSEDRYIEFLIETGNSVHAISVGCSKGIYITPLKISIRTECADYTFEELNPHSLSFAIAKRRIYSFKVSAIYRLKPPLGGGLKSSMV